MDLFLQLCYLFFVGAIVGWCIELVFRRCFSPVKKWINPGFLNGPYLPLYGFGTCVLYLLCSFDLSFIANPFWNVVVRLLFMAIAMTVIEYIAGIIFIKGLGVKLWDYSCRPGNIQGIICPLFSILWTVCGGLFYWLLYNPLSQGLAWFADNITFCFVLGMFYGVLIVDFAISIRLVANIRKYVREKQLVLHYESFKESIRENIDKLQGKYNFLLPLKGAKDITESLTVYFEELKRKAEELKEKAEQLKDKIENTESDKQNKK